MAIAVLSKAGVAPVREQQYDIGDNGYQSRFVISGDRYSSDMIIAQMVPFYNIRILFIN